jgi:hypothetical protein
MAIKVFLGSGDSFTAANNDINVVGASGTGTEKVIVQSGVTGLKTDANIERIDVAGNLADMKFVAVAGTGMQIQNSAGVVVATIPSLNQNATVAFTDGSATLVQTGATAFTVGGQAVSTTTAAGFTTTTLGSNFNTAVKSDAGSTTSTPATPTFSVAAGAVSVNENNNATFTVTLSSAQSTATTVNYALAGTGGATIGTDTGTVTVAGATAAGSTLTFPAGVTSATITVPVSIDSNVETGEGVSLTLSTPSTGAALGTATASTLIPDNAAPTFTLASDGVAGTPTQEGKTITFTITPSGIVDKDTVLTVNLTGQAVGGITSTASASDFSAAQTVTFKAGETLAKTTSITVADDSTTEGIEGYKASLLDSTFTEKASTTGTITDPTTTYVLTGASTVNEDASVTYTVTADRAAPTGGITIPYTLSGNATLTTDYTGSTLSTGTITIAAGATTGTLTLNAVADNATEATAENVIVTLGTPSTGSVTTGSVTTAIVDTSQGLAAGAVALTASSTSVNEGTAVTYTVTLGTAAPTGGLSIPYTLSGTSTLTSDWTGSSATTGNIAVAAGATAGTLTITTVADTTTEGSETLINTLGTMPSGYTLVTGKGTATATINDTSLTVAGSTFTLTTTVDSGASFTGTAGNDTFNAADPAQLQVADVLVGGAGIDTLNYTNTAAAVALPAASLTGIEIINARAVTNGITSGDLSVYSGLTTFNSDRSNAAITVTNLPAGGTFGVLGNGSVSNAAAAAFGYTAAATAGILDFSGGTLGTSAVTITGTGLTSQTINSTVSANVNGAFTGAATVTSTTFNATTGLTFAGAVTNLGATVTVTGAGAVDLFTTALEAGVTTINASANTAGLTAALGTLVTQTVTGSSGNDVLTSGAVLTTGSVNAGSGTDTLVLGTNVAHANTTTLAAKYTNFETLRLQGTWDAALITSITALELNAGASTITNVTAAQAAAVKARGDLTTTTLTLASSAGTSDTLTMTMGLGTTVPAAANNAANSGVMTLTGFEIVNLVANPSATATAGTNRTSTVTGAIVDTSLTTVNLTGTAFSLTDISSTKAVTWNGSALTGDGATTPLGLTVAGSAFAGSTITGSVVGDTFTIGAEGSNYNAGSGTDTVTTTAAILSADGTTDVTIAGGAGTDTLTITGALTLIDNHFTNVTGMEKLNTAATTAVSYTGLGAATKAAFADGMTVTSGTLANAATYTFGGGLYDKAVTLTLVSSGDGVASDDAIAITTGAAADTISVTAASWVGATGGAAGTLAVTTGAGNDTITVSVGTLLAITTATSLTFNAGTGADTISLTSVNAASGLTPTFTVAAGDSLVSAYDSVTGFDMGTGSLFSSTLDFASVGLTSYSATAATGFTAGEFAVAVSAAGLVTFTGTSSASATLAQKIAAVQSVVITNAGDSALFTHGANSYVFNNNTTADSLVELVGVAGTTLVTTNATTASAIFIA